MNTDEAKFVLSAFRDDGRYSATDPLFAEALESADQDPKLRAWLESSGRFDSIIASKIDQVEPPASLRESILVGARASQVRSRWVRRISWLAVAASIAIAGYLGTRTTVQQTPAGNSVVASISSRIFSELSSSSHGHTGNTPDSLALARSLNARSDGLAYNLGISAADMEGSRCRQIDFGGSTAFEVCFVRNGIWYHLFVTPVDASNSSIGRDGLEFLEEAGAAIAMWTEGENLIALASTQGIDALKRIL